MSNSFKLCSTHFSKGVENCWSPPRYKPVHKSHCKHVYEQIK